MGERAIVSGEKTRPGAPRSSPTAFQTYQRGIYMLLEDAKQQLPEQYPELVRILAKKLEREM